MYKRQAYTDMPEKELVAEVIREKALLYMRDEIPHGIAVVVERFKERPGTDLVDIDVNIYCERESHKGMVIGKGGAKMCIRDRQSLETTDAKNIIRENKYKNGAEGYAAQYHALCDILAKF